jgi:muramoyltetrapeptide carboxypeptidase
VAGSRIYLTQIHEIGEKNRVKEWTVFPIAGHFEWNAIATQRGQFAIYKSSKDCSNIRMRDTKTRTISVIAPGSSVASDVLMKIRSFLKTNQEGLRARWIVHPSRDLQTENRLSLSKFKNLQNFSQSFPFLSAPDSKRWEALLAALLDKDSEIIWGIRGGYGANRLVDALMDSAATLRPLCRKKVLVGISDLTCLHFILNRVWKWPSLHAPLLDRVVSGELPVSIGRELFRILRGEQAEVLHKGLKPLNQSASKMKSEIHSKVLGGNLCVLTSHLSDKNFPSLGKCFLFLEDRGERAYRLDRMLQQLIRSGELFKVQGVLFGHFTDCSEPDGKNFVNKVLLGFAKQLDQFSIPVFSGIESGHGKRLRPLPLGTSAVLQFQSGSNWNLMVKSPFINH